MFAVALVVAFVLGLGARLVGLPPLVGFLVAGFVLKAMGMEMSEQLESVADAGVLLLLFGIGLKLKIKSLLRPEIFATATAHMAITVIVMAGALLGLGAMGLPALADADLRLALMLGFAMSFSSTVFAVKVLEDKGEMGSRYGIVAIGILVVQDFVAVLFITISAGEMPSPWALALLGLPLLRPILMRIIYMCGHGELLVLVGVLLTIGGAGLFKAVGLKPDLGALLVGALVAGHAKTDELSRSLLGFKDLFLVGFFLTIGLSGTPSLQDVGVAALLLLAIPLKVALFFVLMTRFKLRARTSTLGALSLANYSEFGLIVASLAYTNGWLSEQWLIILAIAVSLSFVCAAPINTVSEQIYKRWHGRLCRWETDRRLPGDSYLELSGAEVLVFGMGRVGTSAYDTLVREHGKIVRGIELDEEKVKAHEEAGRVVLVGDATDSDLWARAGSIEGVELVILAMSNHQANLYAAEQISSYDGHPEIAATALHEDEMEELRSVGAEKVYNFYTEAGAGLVDHIQKSREGET